jgi:PAS domain S-box-containing protein
VKAIENATPKIRRAPDAPGDSDVRPTADELTGWLLEGRFFTIDPGGAVTSWSPAAEGAFGWRRKDVVGQAFVDVLLAPAARAGQAERVTQLLTGASAASGYTGEVDAVDAAEQSLRAAFAMVPIQLGVGYEFNSLLQDVGSRPQDALPKGEAKERRQSVLSLLERALEAGSGSDAGSEEGARVAGALVLFRTGAAVAGGPAGADNVVSISDAAGVEEARSQLERARRDADEGRVQVRSLEGQLEEARREAQRSRNEADMTRQEAGDARDALIVAQRGAEEARRQLEDSRRIIDEVRAAAEAGRIRSEEAQREADSLRAQLREARDSARGMVGRADDELAQLQEQSARADRELADARAEAARHAAEVEPLRERYQAAQRELGSLRADLESAQAAAAERETVGDRRAGELERTRAELDARVAESSAARREVNQLRAELSERDAQAEAVSSELESRAAEVASLREQLAERAAELSEATAAQERLAAARADQVATGSAGDQNELGALREAAQRLRAAFDGAPMGGALIAPDGRYLEVSESLCEALGYRAERLLSVEPPSIVHPDDVDSHRELARRMLAGEQATARGYRRYLHADGATVTMRESVSMVRDREGRPAMFVVQLEEALGAAPGPATVVDADVDATDALPSPPAERDGVSGTEMRRALEDDLLQLHCQPVLDLHTDTIAQYELLIRMVAEDGRLILPQAFLGPARRAGLANAIDRWVVRKAIALLHETAIGGQDVGLEVNLSPEAVHDPDLPAMIEEELASTPVDPGRLVLEVSGATASEHLEETRALAKRLRGLGCRFALDAFRSNFGSFRLLRDLPLDYLKLDGELVGSLTESRTSQLIVKALVDVAVGTGMKTVGVFVSDEQTVAMLRELGVDYAQGYTVGRPKPVRDTLGHQVEVPRLPPG